VTASPSERAQMAQLAASFTEEDLTRYLQLSLDLFRDLQFSLQPRFHLEIGLLKMIQAGKLVPIEEALASLGTSSVPAPPRATSLPPTPPVASAPARAPAPPQRTGPSPFELDRQKKATAPVPPPPAPGAPPSADDDWRAKLHTAMVEAGMTFSADAIAQSEAALVNNELQITAPKQFQLDLGQEEIRAALKQLGHPTLRFKVTFGQVASAPAPLQKPVAKAEDEVTERALAHPEVKRFRELFGGEVRTVRNLKDN
jgi:DNA polymerase III subunit gamma/tau